VALVELDAWTITWCRFAGSMIAVGLWLGTQKQLPLQQLQQTSVWRWLLPGTIGLTGNYVMYVLGLRYTSPAVAQTVMQAAPLLLLVFGMFFFHERFSRVQWIGFGALVLGLVVFFNRRLPELLNPAEGWSFGVLILLCSAVSWACYGVCQKQLLRHLSSGQILFLMYAGATVVLLPTVQFQVMPHLHLAAILALLFGVANTVLAYGAFGLALEVWEVSRVSSVVAAAPLFTLAASMVGEYAAIAWVTPETLNVFSIAGSFFVVAGSMICALGRGRNLAGSTRSS
jgi:drug/metabolite transporter (DMT)-like permease